jgi:hypothetical protein
MKGIGGNTEALIQVSSITSNAIGEQVKQWQDVQRIKGWLDLSGGETRYTTFNAKIQESSHVFVADYVPLDKRIEAETARAIIAGKQYDITLIDNPMRLNAQLEIHLKYTGGV